MKIENFDFEAVGASHEVVEAIVGQTYAVIIWRHDTSDDSVWTYTKKRLPEGFYGLLDAPMFYSEKPVPGMETAREVSLDLGTVEEDEVYDNLAEPLAKLMALSASLDRPC